MGTLRLLLALSVVAGHSQTFFRPFFFINAKAAVICFFVISGFYMALVLNEKYTSIADFLINRWLRIWVPYIVVTALSALYFWPPNTAPLAVLLNVTLVGQDIAGSFHLIDRDNLVLPQAWSLAIELTFYFIAAFTFWRSLGVVVAFVAGVVVSVALARIGYLDVTFAPSVFSFFALGAVAYLAYRHTRQWSVITNRAAATAVTGTLVIYLATVDMYGIFSASALVLYATVAAVLPFLFAVTRDNSIDRMIGELSYPTYLVHFITIDAANRIDFSAFGGSAHAVKSSFVLVATLALAATVYLAVISPLDRWRAKRDKSLVVAI